MMEAWVLKEWKRDVKQDTIKELERWLNIPLNEITPEWRDMVKKEYKERKKNLLKVKVDFT